MPRFLLCLGWSLSVITTLFAAEKKPFDIPAGTADKSLKQFTAQSGAEVIYVAESVRGISTNAVKGTLTPAEALQRLLASSPLTVRQDEKTATFMIARDPKDQRAAQPESETPSVRPRTDASRGSIEGRVIDPANESYLERARLSVEGTLLEAFTDADGYYRLSGVPVGEVRLKVFYTGMVPVIETVAIIANQTARRDVSMVVTGRRGPATGEVVKLSEFVVSTSKEMAGAAIAINEQRFAPNIMNVISADEFGGVAEGNAVEVMKFLPGVTVDTGGTINNRFVSINGVSPDNVPVTVDGFSLASIATAGTGRAVQIDMISVNNLARIEVSYSPTPESKGAALAGSVNMVPRSAFERSHPLFNGSVYVTMRDNARDFNKVPGPRREASRNVHPGFDFSYIAPVNKKFGYTLSGGHSSQFAQQDNVTLVWRGGGTATNGGTFPDTTPDKPYLSGYTVLDGPSLTRRDSLGATLDYKLTSNDRLSFAFQWSSFDVLIRNNSLTFNVNRVSPGQFSATSTHGFAGAGEFQMSRGERNRINRTYMPTLVWRHDGPIWKAVAGAGLSRAQDQNFGSGKGFFRSSLARRTGVTVSFDDNSYLRPGVITVTDGTTGAPVDPCRLDSYALASGGDNQDSSTDLQRSAYANLRRDFHGQVPLTVKGGLDLAHSARDLRSTNPTFTFVGRDGRGSTAPAGSDDSAVPFLDPVNSKHVPGYGFPPTQMVSNWLLWEYYQTNPSYFAFDKNSEYRAQVTGSKHAEELISAAYFRGDLALLERRLKLVGGIRAEQTNIKAEGPLTDGTRNFQRDARGAFILGANGRPALILPASDALGVSQLTYLDRGQKTGKEYLRLFPSLNASYNLSENLIARAAHYYSIGRPNFNQYAGGLILPDTSQAPSQSNRITVTNAGIKAWEARTTNVRLEYYLGGVGQVSVGAFQRDFKNAFAGNVVKATPEFLALYGLDAASYGDYDASTQVNVQGIVRMTGVDFNYKQVLTFLPDWARGLQVFANGSAQRATGPSLGSYAGSNYVPRSGSWGVSFTREKFNVRMNWSYRSRTRQDLVSPAQGIGPETYNWATRRLYLDVLGECYFWKRIALFANLRNIGSVMQDTEIYGPSTPPVARLRSRLDNGSLWTFGIKGSY